MTIISISRFDASRRIESRAIPRDNYPSDLPKNSASKSRAIHPKKNNYDRVSVDISADAPDGPCWSSRYV